MIVKRVRLDGRKTGRETGRGSRPAHPRVHGQRRQGGQALVLMVGAMVASCALVALVIDGGNAWANQRVVQAGTDATAEAGAVVMAQRFAGVPGTDSYWDGQVKAAIDASAAANGVTVASAYYTDICGIPLKKDGSAALKGDGSYDFATASPVGAGMPAVLATTPDCPSKTAGPPAGVIVLTTRNLRTYLASVVGINQLTVNAQATAAAGFLQQSNAGTLLPIAVPVYVVTCDGSNNPVYYMPKAQWSADGHTVYKVPMCKNGPGNVGWLDWTPTSGGVNEVIDSINNPNNPPIPLPSWQYVAETGNPNASGLEAAIREHDGEVVMIPQFDNTCNPGHGNTPDSSLPAINTPPNYGCPAGSLGGNGTNQWYRMPSFAYFQLCISTDQDCVAAGALHGAYLNGNNKAVCDTGNGATSCLAGKFVSIISTGTIGAGNGGGGGSSRSVGVQLIK